MSNNDFGKTQFLDDQDIRLRGRKAPDHDQLLAEVLEYDPSLFPGLSSLTPEQQEQYKQGLLFNFNLGQMVQGENLPYNLYATGDVPLLSKSLRLVAELYDFAGVTEHTNRKISGKALIGTPRGLQVMLEHVAKGYEVVRQKLEQDDLSSDPGVYKETVSDLAKEMSKLLPLFPEILLYSTKTIVSSISPNLLAKFEAFFCHDSDNHGRVREAEIELKERGLCSFIDYKEITNQIDEEIVKGIDQSLCMLFFLTEASLRKVNGEDGTDYVKREFKYAFKKFGLKKIIVVACDEYMVKTPLTGLLSFNLGTNLIFDLSAAFKEATPQREKKILYDELYQRIMTTIYGKMRKDFELQHENKVL